MGDKTPNIDLPSCVGQTGGLMTPLFERDGFLICFEAQPEDIGMRSHFVGECGWTDAQYRRIKNYAWFSAKVSAWKDGKELGTDYLGACCYKTEEEFYTKYQHDYFSDMVQNVIDEAREREKAK